MRLILIGLLFIQSELILAQSFNPVADTDGQSDVAAGTNATLNASQWCHLFLRFDLSTVSAVVADAKLRIYQNNQSVAYTLNVNTTSTDNWSEGGTKPTTAELITSIIPSTSAGYKEIDITGLVQKKMTGGKIISVALTTDQNGWISFNSRENASNKPQLVITTATGNMYTITLTNPNGTVTKNPDRVYYSPGTSVELTAVPDAVSTFTGWSGDVVSTANPLTVTLNKNYNLTAQFLVPVIAPDSILIDPKATPSTIDLFRFLKSNYLKKMLTGCWTETQFGGNNKVVSCSGKYPAIWGQDMSSWYANRNDPLWNQTWQNTLNGFKTAWERGQILQLSWHWLMVSSKINGAYTRDTWGREVGNSNSSVQMMTDQQWIDILTPGTPLYTAMIEDIDYHVVNFLKKIVDAKGEPIPILFRPLHEIDGGWFWWTCTSNPQNTAKLYKILQDRIINFHQVHNLIWIWNNGVGVSNGSWPPYQQIDNAKRAAYYPGDAYCDIVGIDLYGFDPVNRGSYANTGKTYRDAWNMLKAAITKNKMLALCEAEALPDAQKCFTDPNYAPWLYCLPWYAENYYDDISKTVNICTWNNAQFNSSYVINKGVYLSQTITAVDDPLSEKRAVVLYPNPLTHGKARIELQGFSSYNKITVVVHDYTGRLRYTTLKTTGNAIEIPYTAFSKGLNLIKLRSGDFEKTLKLMVQ